MRGLGPGDVPAEVQEALREYRYGTLFGCPPSQLLDEPAWKLRWWLEIQSLEKEANG